MGGGTGGFALSGGLNTELGAKFGGLLWALGANGGNGGDGANVTVNSTATLLSTQGANSAGILAQSLGAGGGNGGTATVGDASLSKYLAGFTLGLGGQAGSTGNGGNVTVTNAANIVTQGDNSDAILAQSIGGGGGNGGDATSVLALVGFNASLAIGGSGASGGSGGTVSVGSGNGSISTSGFESSGIVAQSIGGGGGNGGAKVSGLPIPGDSSLGFKLGGNSGGSGNGGLASIDNSSAITTTGIFAENLLAQSLGGGGGLAGAGIFDSGNTNVSGLMRARRVERNAGQRRRGQRFQHRANYDRGFGIGCHGRAIDRRRRRRSANRYHRNGNRNDGGRLDVRRSR